MKSVLPALANDGRCNVPGIPEDAVGLVDADRARLRPVASRPCNRVGRILRAEVRLDGQDGYGEAARTGIRVVAGDVVDAVRPKGLFEGFLLIPERSAGGSAP